MKEKRKKSPKPLKKNERRQDMKIITSASQGDIYVWSISLALMLAVIAVFVVFALIGGIA